MRKKGVFDMAVSSIAFSWLQAWCSQGLWQHWDKKAFERSYLFEPV